MLDGAHLLANASIRDFQQGKAGYVTDAVEQALLLPKDMADLGSMRLHKVFLNLKRDLEVVSPSITFFFFFSFFLFLKCFPPFFFTMFLSSTSHSSHIQGRRDNKFLPAIDERRRKAHCGRGGLQCGQQKNKQAEE